MRPKFISAYGNRGNAWFKKGEWDKAIADYTEVIKLNPKLAKAYNNRGKAWFEKGDLDKAIADYNEAIKIDPQYIGARDNLKQVLAKKHKRK